MDILNIINAVLIALGVPTIIASAIYIGRKLQVLDDIRDAHDKTKKNIGVIAGCLATSPHIGFDQTKLASYSPLRLTKEGEKYLQTVGFAKIFQKYPDPFFNFINDENPTTKFDVEASAFKAFMFLLGTSQHFRPLKIYAFNHPKEDLREIAKYASIYIRDEYLERHPEISA